MDKNKITETSAAIVTISRTIVCVRSEVTTKERLFEYCFEGRAKRTDSVRIRGSSVAMKAEVPSNLRTFSPLDRSQIFVWFDSQIIAFTYALSSLPFHGPYVLATDTKNRGVEIVSKIIQTRFT